MKSRSEHERNLSTQISFDFSEPETEIINVIVSQMITANSLYSNDSTSSAIQAARDQIKPIVKKYIAGEIIVNSGEVINAQSWEALQELGYTEPKNKALDYISAILLTIVILMFNALYVRRIRQTSGKKIQDLPVIAGTFLVFLFAAKLVIPTAILSLLFRWRPWVDHFSLYDYETGLIFPSRLSILGCLQ